MIMEERELLERIESLERRIERLEAWAHRTYGTDWKREPTAPVIHHEPPRLVGRYPTSDGDER